MNNKVKNFLQNGMLAIMMASSVASALAQPVNQMLEAQPQRAEIVKIIQNDIPKEDLAYLIQMGSGSTDSRVSEIYSVINKKIEEKFGSGHVESVKKNLGKEITNLSHFKDIEINYSWAIPKEVLIKYKNAPKNDTSVAENAFDTSNTCRVTIKLAVDDNGRLFEASELISLSNEEVSKKTDKEIHGVMKEAIAHEVSHCVLHKELKKENFEMSFSKEFKEGNPIIASVLNSKIHETKTKIAQGVQEEVNFFDLMLFTNYNENFSDVFGAFSRFGDHPNAEKIYEVRDSLLEVAKFRENTGMTHKTQAAVQYALEKLEDAAKMNPEQRLELAKEIAGDSLLNNMRMVLEKMVGVENRGIVSSYLVGGLKLTADGVEQVVVLMIVDSL